MTRVRSLLLTIGAVIGGFCLLVALAALVLDVKPLVFRSGSMGPEIPAGALGLSRPVAAADLKIGDVVSVVSVKHSRVTHRIVGIQGAGESRVLTLQGDTNPSPDAETYQVIEVDRLFWSVPWVGHAVAWLGGPLGLFLLGGLSVGLLMHVIRPPRGRGDPPPKGKRRAGRAARAAGPVAILLVVTQGAGTSAAFSDTARLTSGATDAGSIVSPSARATSGNNPNCTANNGLTSSTITFRWNGVTPGTQPRPQLVNHQYVIRFFTRPNNVQVGPDVVQAHAGPAGEVQSVAYSATLLGGLLGLNLLSNTNLRVEVRSNLIDTPWYGGTVVSTNFNSFALLGIVNFTCNA